MYMFQGDVRFSWQGSVLINVTSIFRVGILVSSGIPHEFLFTVVSCRDVALLDIVARQLRLPALSWDISPNPSFRFLFAAVFSWVFGQASLYWCGCYFPVWMSDSSSDTTHEAILHNVVSHQLRFARQLQQLQTSVSSLQQQLNTIQEQLQMLLAAHGHSVQSSPIQTSDLETSKDKQ